MQALHNLQMLNTYISGSSLISKLQPRPVMPLKLRELHSARTTLHDSLVVPRLDQIAMCIALKT